MTPEEAKKKGYMRRVTLHRHGQRMEIRFGLEYLPGNRAPYFAITTENGAAHDDILALAPEFRPLMGLHLCYPDGAPMYAEENGEYFIREYLNAKTEKGAQNYWVQARRHFRVTDDELKQVVDEYSRTLSLPDSFYQEKEQQRVFNSFVEGLRSRWKQEADEAVRFILEYDPADYEDDDDDDEEMWAETPALLLEGDQEPMELTEIREYYWAEGVWEAESYKSFYILAVDEECAEKAVSEYYHDMAENDPQEFACIVGEGRLIKWALNQPDEYGFRNADEFIAAVAKEYAQELARYDGEERRGWVNEPAMEEMGWDLEKDHQDFGTGWYPVLVFKG